MARTAYRPTQTCCPWWSARCTVSSTRSTTEQANLDDRSTTEQLECQTDASVTVRCSSCPVQASSLLILSACCLPHGPCRWRVQTADDYILANRQWILFVACAHCTQPAPSTRQPYASAFKLCTRAFARCFPKSLPMSARCYLQPMGSTQWRRVSMGQSITSGGWSKNGQLREREREGRGVWGRERGQRGVGGRAHSWAKLGAREAGREERRGSCAAGVHHPIGSTWGAKQYKAWA